jgi:anaerobic magnesium-protoporphyrin IX monomethyl ester cyclase
MMDTGATNFADLASARDRARDTSRPVALIGFQKQENLGLGYLAATLSIHGYQALVLDFEQDPAEILAEIKGHDPIIVGFSLIFQFYLPRFQSLVRFLRHAGVGCHFTMGGHFPSLSYQHALDLLPELDSIVRFEGELTLLEMADVLSTGQDYRTISGIAYRGDNGVVTTPMRPLVTDLDQLPFPVRRHERHALLGHCAAQILASRGCIRTCSFCSIHMFYRSAPGKVVRTRKPARVVEEMRLLHQQHGITIFMFQDDDFPVFGPVWRRWANEFVDELHRNRLPGRVIWKINCRGCGRARTSRPHARRGTLLSLHGTRVRKRGRAQDASQTDYRRAEPPRRRNPESPGDDFRVRLHAIRTLDHVRFGARKPFVPTGGRWRRQDRGDVLPDGAVRRHSDQGRLASHRTAARRRM